VLRLRHQVPLLCCGQGSEAAGAGPSVARGGGQEPAAHTPAQNGGNMTQRLFNVAKKLTDGGDLPLLPLVGAFAGAYTLATDPPSNSPQEVHDASKNPEGSFFDVA
jgi:hypothetical protein